MKNISKHIYRIQRYTLSYKDFVDIIEKYEVVAFENLHKIFFYGYEVKLSPQEYRFLMRVLSLGAGNSISAEQLIDSIGAKVTMSKKALAYRIRNKIKSKIIDAKFLKDGRTQQYQKLKKSYDNAIKYKRGVNVINERKKKLKAKEKYLKNKSLKTKWLLTSEYYNRFHDSKFENKVIENYVGKNMNILIEDFDDIFNSLLHVSLGRFSSEYTIQNI